MKRKDIYLIFLTTTLLIELYIIYLFLYSKTFYFGDFVTLSILILSLIVSFFEGAVKGSIFSTFMLTIYGLAISIQSLLGYESTFRLSYPFIFIYPTATFICGVMGSKVEVLYNENQKYKEALKNLVTIDIDSGFKNKSEFLRDLESEMSKSKRYKVPLTLLIVKLNYFEELEAIHGKENMVKIVKNIASKIVKTTRITDDKYRIEKDTFSILLSNTNEEGAKIVKNKLKELLLLSTKKELDIPFETRVSLKEYHGEKVSNLEFIERCKEDLEYDV